MTAVSGEMAECAVTESLQNAFANMAVHSIDVSIHLTCMDWRHRSDVMNAGSYACAEIKERGPIMKPVNFLRVIKSIQVCVFVLTALLVFTTDVSADDRLPENAPLVDREGSHLGVKTCASSTCHGAVQPWQNSSVLQNEFVTWSTKDAHARAYKTLLSEKSKFIASNLGLKNAHTAEVCLQCHTDNVPKKFQAKFFNIEDGVGCEACHGGAENWLGLHVAGTGSHSDNIAAGMSPTDNLEFRAELCLSCHVGMQDKAMTHNLLGAGHPRLVFELDTYMVGNTPKN